jgi:hypothetical protein
MALKPVMMVMDSYKDIAHTVDSLFERGDS